ncbi:MAG: signal recognition particle subunit SRP19/SEC65 family protein [Methanobacteriota archaeon]
MVSKDEKKVVIWPSYFEKPLSRVMGRKVARKYARDKPPSVEDIAKAAKSLGFNPVIEKNALHPSRVWKKEGRVLIEKRGAKQKVLVQIANRL